MITRFIFLFAFSQASNFVMASDLYSSADLWLEGRSFTSDDNSETNDHNLAVATQFEAKQKTGRFSWKLKGFGRYDELDSQRRHAYLQEAWAAYRQEIVQIKAGFQLLNWSATEAFHPADVVNSRNFDGNLYNPQKIGEPLLSSKLRLGGHQLTLFYQAYRTSPLIPDGSSRTSPLSPSTKLDDARWVETDGTLSTDTAASGGGIVLEHSLSGYDLHWHIIKHWDRTKPQFTINPGNGHVIPVFFPVVELAGTLQTAIQSTVIKAELSSKMYEKIDDRIDQSGLTQPHDYRTLALGWDYGYSHMDGAESTYILEWQQILGMPEDRSRKEDIFQNDVLIGYRYALHDVMSRQYMAGAIFDLGKPYEHLLFLTASQRLSDSLTLKAELNIVEADTGGPSQEGLQIFRKNDSLALTLIKYL